MIRSSLRSIGTGVASLAVLTFSSPDARGGRDQVAMDVAWLQGAAAGATVAAAPSVSIVIPCHDNVGLTRACLRALRETGRQRAPSLHARQVARRDGTAAQGGGQDVGRGDGIVAPQALVQALLGGVLHDRPPFGRMG